MHVYFLWHKQLRWNVGHAPNSMKQLSRTTHWYVNFAHNLVVLDFAGKAEVELSYRVSQQVFSGRPAFIRLLRGRHLVGERGGSLCSCLFVYVEERGNRIA